MRRPSDKHINNEELSALVPSSGNGQVLSAQALSEAEQHMQSCGQCTEKVSKYRQLLIRQSIPVPQEAAPPESDCPKEEDVDWYEVAAGLWPELKAKQLIAHAALCNHCGPLLRAATSVDDDPTSQEEKLLAQLRAPSRPVIVPPPVVAPRRSWRVAAWLIPALTLVLVVGMVRTRPSSTAPLTGPEFAAFAVNTHRQHVRGNLALDIHSDSEQSLNDWFKANAQLPVGLPTSELPGEQRPYRLEGARLLPAINKSSAAYVAYQMQTGPVGLIVTPESVARASGGVVAGFKKVSFHYAIVSGYRVVTWSVHGLTYALVSQEGNLTQQSCMVCHSAMRDRDLSHTPTPLREQRGTIEQLWQ